MPLHDYIRQIYETAEDRTYVVRFIDYVLGKRFKRMEFIVKGQIVEPLITGVLENKKTNQRYNSLAEFYSDATKQTVDEYDVEILKKINITINYSIWRIICSVKEVEILGFFDQKYRAFLMYRDVRARIKQWCSISTNEEVSLWWNGNEYRLWHTRLGSDDTENPYRIYDLFEAYENGGITGLYYNTSTGRYLITDY
jgi:hypothetical protein